MGPDWDDIRYFMAVLRSGSTLAAAKALRVDQTTVARRRGAEAVRAFAGADESAWHSNFETFFEYIDVQKLRTPKGLDWPMKQLPRAFSE